MTSLIVFSHLRWAFVYQRPQHLLARLGRHFRVVFIEEPLCTPGPAFVETRAVAPGVTVVVPHTPVDAPGFHDDKLAALSALIEAHLRTEQIVDYVVWLYTPMALPLVAPLRPRAVVYDCMDELSAFDHAPRQLQQRESALLNSADLVLTGGPALYEAKRHRHANIHCLPSSVDSGHYAPERLDDHSPHRSAVAELQGPRPAARLGFFGVIDERLDTGLLGQLADAHPDWQIVMVGPVVKIDPATLPRAANILWIGAQSYERLPYFVNTWDLCLMPFAINRATRFISPTKTLEYFAGERQVVSTPVPDVLELYGDSVDIGVGAEFIRACEQAIARGPQQKHARLEAMRKAVNASSWDATAQRVLELINEAVAERRHAQPRRGTAVLEVIGGIAGVDVIAPSVSTGPPAVPDARAVSP